jgi:UDP-N-acetyl-2-amino-2-deoxyglucuronate dehydrogenase
LTASRHETTRIGRAMAKPSLGFGIVGVGMIAEFHAQAIRAIDGAHLVASYARRDATVREFAQRHSGAACTEMGEFLARDDLDIVAICTPSVAHLEPCLAAAAAGKHVICEKPLEVTTARIDSMIEACDRAGVMLAGIFPRRFNPSTTYLKQAIDHGRFGRIALVEASVKWWRTQAYYDSGDWRGTWALDGGGALMNQGIHTVDLLLHLMGDVHSVRAETRLVAHAGIEVEDTAIAMLTFKNGTIGVIQGSTACWSAAGHPAEIHIMGSGGSAIMADDRFRVWEFQDAIPEDSAIRETHGAQDGDAGAGAADPGAIDFKWHQRNFEDALAALWANEPPWVNGAEARRAVALIRAIYDSAAQGGCKVEVH